MTIIQLEYLLAVANCGSFSLAAEHCFVTQPSLSMQVKALEEELGVVLLDRSKKPVIPTEAGEVVLDRARETKSEMTELSPDYIHVKMTPQSSWQMKLLPINDSTKVICVVATVCAPACDSHVKFYTTDWKELDRKSVV